MKTANTIPDSDWLDFDPDGADCIDTYARAVAAAYASGWVLGDSVSESNLWLSKRVHSGWRHPDHDETGVIWVTKSLRPVMRSLDGKLMVYLEYLD